LIHPSCCFLRLRIHSRNIASSHWFVSLSLHELLNCSGWRILLPYIDMDCTKRSTPIFHISY
jgi:hypothetical protein